jgi:hypothetical protein
MAVWIFDKFKLILWLGAYQIFTTLKLKDRVIKTTPLPLDR